MRWTRQRPLRMSESQGGPWSVSDRRRGRREAMFAYGKTVWSWRPWLASSRRRCCEARPGAQHRQFAGDGGKRNSSPGRERGISRKPIAQGMPDCSDCTCMLVCASSHISRTRDRGCSKHPAFPAPSSLWAIKNLQSPGETRRGNAEVCLGRHCERSEAIHAAACGAMDCFVAGAPRNDGATPRGVRQWRTSQFSALSPYSRRRDPKVHCQGNAESRSVKKVRGR